LAQAVLRVPSGLSAPLRLQWAARQRALSCHGQMCPGERGHRLLTSATAARLRCH